MCVGWAYWGPKIILSMLSSGCYVVEVPGVSWRTTIGPCRIDASAFRYTPGVIGTVGHTLGQAGINIAGMQVARSEVGGKALMALTVDSDVSDEILATIKKETNAESVRAVVLVD